MTTDTRDALLPCPFCGGVVEMHHPKGGAYNDITYLLCDSCGAVCSFRPNLKGSKAMAAWNCRTPRPEDARDAARMQAIAARPGWLRYLSSGTRKGKWAFHNPMTSYPYEVFDTPQAAIDAALTQPEAK